MNEDWTKAIPFISKRSKAKARGTLKWYEKLEEQIQSVGWKLSDGQKFQATYSNNGAPGQLIAGQKLLVSSSIVDGARRYSARTYTGPSGPVFVYGRGQVKGHGVVLQSDSDMDMADLKKFITEKAIGREFGKLHRWVEVVKMSIAKELGNPSEFRAYSKVDTNKASIECLMSDGIKAAKRGINVSDNPIEVATGLITSIKTARDKKLKEGNVFREVLEGINVLRRQDAKDLLHDHADEAGLKIRFSSTAAMTFSWFASIVVDPDSYKEVAVIWREPSQRFLPAIRGGEDVSAGWFWMGLDEELKNGLPTKNEIAAFGCEAFTIQEQEVPTMFDHIVNWRGTRS